MKLNGSMLVVVAMMVGAAAASGCNKPQDKISDKGNDVAATDTAVATPEDNPDTAPVAETAAAAPGVEKDDLSFRFYAPIAPPALRVEERVASPGAGYFYRPGYYGWSGREHVWYGGRWYPHRLGYDYVNPSWHAVGGRWGYRPGGWYRHR